jgi:glutamyl-tRNA synthetase
LHHVTNTATQIQILAALGGTAPRFAHHSLLTGPGGEALSKRLGTLSLRDLRARGVEPMALVSLLARLGSSDPVVPLASLDQAAAGFDISRFGAAPTRFDPDDLAPLSARILHGLDYPQVSASLDALGVPADAAPVFWAAIRENVGTRAEIGAWWEVCQGRFETTSEPEDAEFVAQALAMLPPRPWDETSWSVWTAAVRQATGRKGRALFQPLRRALTGRDSGPDMAALMPLLRRTGAGPDQAG